MAATLYNDDCLNVSVKDVKLIYLDPPYLPSTRSKKHAYKFDWELADHVELIAALNEIKGTFFLSGYRDGPYNNLKFKCHEFMAATQNKTTTEYLWTNL